MLCLRKSRAFTLIELLVVVAIIALLISILLPSLSKARAMARTVQCASIQKQFGVANHMYADESENHFVPLVVRNETWQPWAWGTNTLFRSMLGLPPGGEVPEGMLCPDLLESHIPHAINNGWNFCYGFNHRGWPLFGEAGGTVTPGAHRPSVTQPAAKLSLTDANDMRVNISYGDYISRWDITGELLWGAEGGIQTVAYRHDEGANILYFDGHVDRSSKENVWFPDSPTDRLHLWEVYE